MIRPLTATDVHSLVELRKQSLEQEPFAFGADPDQTIDVDDARRVLLSKNDEDFILGYFDGDKLGGMLGFQRYTNPKRKHKALIWGMYVDSAYRNAGVGKRLMETALAMAKSIENLRKIILTASSNAIPANRLYTRFGFTEFGREKDAISWNGSSIDEIHYELFL